jgi:hypothetical protein
MYCSISSSGSGGALGFSVFSAASGAPASLPGGGDPRKAKKMAAAAKHMQMVAIDIIMTLLLLDLR